MKKILLIASASSRFTYEYISEVIPLKEYEVHIANIDRKGTGIKKDIKEYYKLNNITILDFSVKISSKFHKLCILLSRLSNIFRLRIAKKYDIIHIHYITEDSIAVPFFSKKVTKVLITVYGSDMLRAPKWKILLLRGVFKRATKVTVATDYVANKLLEFYGDDIKCKLRKCYFGTKNIEHVKLCLDKYSVHDCKQLYNIPTDKLTIFPGYNGSPAHRHIQILELLDGLPKQIRNQLCLVFHCGYALTDEYKNRLITSMKEHNILTFLITDYFTGEELIKLRMCADVMLNLQPTDALSASMLESIAVGSIVIKGDWLVYPELKRKEVMLLSIKRMDDLPELISDIIVKKHDYNDQLRGNAKKIYEMLSWNYCRNNWKKLLE